MVIILIYDFEVFKQDTLLGVLNTETNEITQLWDVAKIREFTNDSIDEIWVGFNSDHYDKILLHGILTGKLNSPDRVFKCSNSVIHAQDSNIPVFNILGKYGIDDFYQSPILSYDVMGDRFFLFS